MTNEFTRWVTTSFSKRILPHSKSTTDVPKKITRSVARVGERRTRFSFFWGVKRRWFVISCWRYGKAHVQGPRSAPPFKTGPIRYPETSIRSTNQRRTASQKSKHITAPRAGATASRPAPPGQLADLGKARQKSWYFCIKLSNVEGGEVQ